jgi:hypothetical protein
LRVTDYWRIDKTSDSFENNGEAKSNEEYSIEEGAKNFCS